MPYSEAPTPRPALPTSGMVRLADILAPTGPLPISKSTWWKRVKSGRYPKPIKLGPRITAWRAEDIYALVRAGPHAILTFS